LGTWEPAWDADSGDCFEDSTSLFYSEEADQGDLPELRVSRKVVRKVIRTEATEFRYERTARQLPKLGPWVGALDGLLLGNETKSARERLTLIRVFEELRG
jgi:hypothetical protein